MPVKGLNKAVALNAKFIVIFQPRHFYQYSGFKAAAASMHRSVCSSGGLSNVKPL